MPSKGKKNKDSDDDTSIKVPAKLIVRLPADAKLFVNDKASKSAKSVRTFVSSPLSSGRTMKVTVRAEIQRDGEVQTLSRVVRIRSGEKFDVTLAFPELSAQRP